MHRFGLLALLGAAIALQGCNHHVFSPPSRFTALDSPATLPDGGQAISFTGGLHGEIFGPTLGAGTIRYRHGLQQDLELQVDTGLAIVTSSADGSTPDTSRVLGALRAGLKSNPIDDFPHLALTAGVGVGGSAAGGFAAADVGVILGYENSTLVPFVAVSPMVSVPIGAAEVKLRNETDDQVAIFDTPSATFGLLLQVGLKLPIDTAWIDIGLSWQGLYDTDADNAQFIGLDVGFGAAF